MARPAKVVPEEVEAPKVEAPESAPDQEEVEAPKVEAPESAPDQIEPTRKFEMRPFEGKFYVYNKEGKRVSTGLIEDEAERLVRGFSTAR